MAGQGTKSASGQGETAFESRDQVETAHGTVAFQLTSETVARALSGPENGWLKVDGRPLWAYAMLRRPGGGETWMIDPLYSQVMEVDNGKAGARAEAEVRDRAWGILKEAFDAWLPTRPDIVARVALAARRREEQGVLDQVERMRADLAKVEAELPALKAAREAAEEEFERASEPAARPGF
jgi:hypothetical protein